MRAFTTSIPILVAAVLATIVAVTNPEPRIVPEPLIAAESLKAADNTERYTYAIPRFAVDLEGDLSPIGETWGNVYDAPAWAPRPTPTPVPVAVAAAVRPLPAISSVPQDCPALIVSTFGANAPAACNIARCESGFNVGAINDNPATGDDSHGLMQINLIGAMGPERAGILRSLGYDVPDVDAAKRLLHTDAVANLRMAYVLSSGGTSWGAWSCPAW